MSNNIFLLPVWTFSSEVFTLSKIYASSDQTVYVLSYTFSSLIWTTLIYLLPSNTLMIMLSYTNFILNRLFTSTAHTIFLMPMNAAIWFINLHSITFLVHLFRVVLLYLYFSYIYYAGLLILSNFHCLINLIFL